MSDRSPFDDPEFRAQLEQLGVRHTPGLAAQMMDQLAPLLAAEGVDLDNLDLEATDLDAVNKALAAATEQHNLMLFTPIGAPRESAYGVLRAVSRALADGDAELAHIALAGLEPEPGADRASVAHVTGVALGTLDRWHSDPALRGAISAARVPKWRDKRSRAAAVDVLALASKRRAFDSLHSLIVRHGGLALLEGSALAVAASVMAQAAVERLVVDDLIDEVLAGESGSATPARRPSRQSGFGASFVRPAGASASSSNRQQRRAAASGDRRTLREFRAWIEQDPEISAADAAEDAGLFEAVLGLARSRGLDLNEPDDIEPLVAVLLDLGESGDPESEGAGDDALAVLHDFVHFKLETDHRPGDWEAAHTAVEVATDDGSSAIELLREVIEEADLVGSDERRRALAALPIVGAVRELLSWIGTSRPITSSGGLRRADIAPVAAMIGVTAQGVAKRPVGGDAVDGVVYAQSMYDVESLTAWWEALVTADVIDRSATRVRPGPEAAGWLAGGMPRLDTAEMLAGLFVADLVSSLAPYGPAVVSELYRRLMQALVPDEELWSPPVAAGLDFFAVSLSEQRIARLAEAGLLENPASEGPVVHEALRGTVARGLIMAMSYLAAGIVDDE
ncbi:hypothetical protein [Agromyces italicus]|uniref:hypothetical protein n=1 Tax=Agromyces italicus TaxID=279572 RepID=UPI0003B711E0|nr:hypothetical protein [Agromyces italicus]